MIYFKAFAFSITIISLFVWLNSFEWERRCQSIKDIEKARYDSLERAKIYEINSLYNEIDSLNFKLHEPTDTIIYH